MQGIVYLLESLGLGANLKDALVFDDVFRAGVNGSHEQFVIIRLVSGKGQNALLLEHVGHGASLSHSAAALAQDAAQIGNGAGLVVGQALDHESDARRAIALIDGALVRHTLYLTGATLDRVLDII